MCSSYKWEKIACTRKGVTGIFLICQLRPGHSFNAEIERLIQRGVYLASQTFRSLGHFRMSTIRCVDINPTIPQSAVLAGSCGVDVHAHLKVAKVEKHWARLTVLFLFSILCVNLLLSYISCYILTYAFFFWNRPWEFGLHWANLPWKSPHKVCLVPQLSGLRQRLGAPCSSVLKASSCFARAGVKRGSGCLGGSLS